MNKHKMKGDWNVLKGKLKAQWAELTDDDMQAIEADRDQLVGRIQQRYGYAQDRVREEIEKFRSQHGMVD